MFLAENNASVLLTNEMHEFINDCVNCNAASIALKLSKKKNWPKEFIIQQIVGKQKAKKKIPVWASCSEIIYPSLLSIEQSSSEQTALYKANLMNGKTFLDLTGGMGVDCFFIAKNFTNIFYNEPNAELFNITVNNLKCLINKTSNYKNKNFYFSNLTAEEFLLKNNNTFDCVFIDPSRRNENKKVVSLSQCSPNVTVFLPTLLNKCNKVFIKTSCMLDITKAAEELKYVQKVYVVSVNNECKELLFECGKTPEKNYTIQCVNISAEINTNFNFTFQEEKNSTAQYSLPKQYLYDPYSSLTKAGAFLTLACKFNLEKISANSHLYTSNKLVKEFPGTTYKVVATVAPNKKYLLKHIDTPSAIWMLRHSAFTEKELIKKTGIKNNSSGIILFSTKDNKNKPIVIICTKI
jgi:16S rRNA G966 N2-methylase RsmD